MKRIVIYCRNEESEQYRPLAARLKMKGAQVQWQAIKYKQQHPKAELVLTPQKHLDEIKELFAGHPAQIMAIEDVEDPAELAQEPEPVVLTKVPVKPVVAAVSEDDAPTVSVAEDDDAPLVLSISDGGDPTPVVAPVTAAVEVQVAPPAPRRSTTRVK